MIHMQIDHMDIHKVAHVAPVLPSWVNLNPSMDK